MIQAGIITIGDEILIGQITDTNSGWIGQQLTERGLDIKLKWSVGDDADEIYEALANVGQKSNLVIVTGGLGPTRDDVTKKAICRFFDTELYFDEDNYAWMIKLFASFGRAPLESHRQQAFLPRGCEVLLNKLGTAPGMLLEKNGVRYLFTPGVPYEMKEIMNTSLLPQLKKWYDLPPISYITIHTVGMGESVIAAQIEDIELSLPEGMSLAYLPGTASVRVRLLAKSVKGELVDERLETLACKIEDKLGDIVYGRDGANLAMSIGKLLESKGKKLVLAESCTGGNVAHLMTSNAGSSRYFNGGMVTYTNELKMNLLDVDSEVLREKGAVSEEVVRQMSESAVRKMDGDIALSISGIAGPGGGTEEKPVGLVWMSVSDGQRTVAKKFNFGKTRTLNIDYASICGLNLIRKFLLGSEMK